LVAEGIAAVEATNAYIQSNQVEILITFVETLVDCPNCTTAEDFGIQFAGNYAANVALGKFTGAVLSTALAQKVGQYMFRKFVAAGSAIVHSTKKSLVAIAELKNKAAGYLDEVWGRVRGRISSSPLNSLSSAFKSGYTIEGILAIPKGSRPSPSTYLKPEYISSHLAKFNNGVTKIISYNPTGTVGPPGGTFVLPKAKADALIQQSGRDINKLEDLLGLNRGDLGTLPYRIDVNSPSGLRMPSGNELGANELWIPGGQTSGGILEATVDQIQPGTYIKRIIFQ
jgi:hypothetical protein